MTLVLEHVSAADREGPRGLARGRLAAIDLALGPGVHAVLGAPEDGTLALAGVLSGALAPLRGRVLVDGLEPAKSAAIRARIGALGPTPRLPEARSVTAAVQLAMAARGDRSDAASLLHAFGLGELSRRDPRSLRFGEARAVEVALCLSTPSPRLVVVHEPFADVAVADLGHVRTRIVELGREGACVVVITSSPADARAMSDGIYLLQKGRFVRAVGGEGAALAPGHAVPLVAWLHDAGHVRALAAAMARRPEVRRTAWEEPAMAGGLASIEVVGDDLEACARALAEEIVATGVEVVAIATTPPSLAEVQAWRPAPPMWMRPAAPPMMIAPAYAPPVTAHPAPIEAPAAPIEPSPAPIEPSPAPIEPSPAPIEAPLPPEGRAS